MACLRPRIGEIQINLLHFTLLKDFREQSCIDAHEHQICKLLSFFLQSLSLLECTEKHTVIHLDPYIIDLWMKLRHIHKEAAFSHTNFNMKRLVFREHLCPFALV